MRNLANVIACALVLPSACATAPLAAAAAPHDPPAEPAGTIAPAPAASYRVVLARGAPDALVLWDATPVVASLVASRARDADANDRLARTALRALQSELGALAQARSITLRVLYDRTGDVSPVYGEATFAGVERYAILTLDGRSAASDRDRWRELADAAKIPAWIGFTVVGKLPPR